MLLTSPMPIPSVKHFGLAFAVGTLFNLALVAAQFLYGIHAHSIAHR
jgi:hypothetical protein